MNWKHYFLVAAVAICSGLLGGLVGRAVPVGSINAEAFRLVDGTGTLLAVLAPSSAGDPVLRLYGKKGEVSIELSASTQGEPRLTLRDGDGRGRAVFGIEADGEPSLNLFDEYGSYLVRLGSLHRTQPSLLLFDRITTPRRAVDRWINGLGMGLGYMGAPVPVTELSASWWAIGTTTGVVQVRLWTSAEGALTLGFSRKDSVQPVLVELSVDGKPRLCLIDRGMKKVIWEAP